MRDTIDATVTSWTTLWECCPRLCLWRRSFRSVVSIPRTEWMDMYELSRPFIYQSIHPLIQSSIHEWMNGWIDEWIDRAGFIDGAHIYALDRLIIIRWWLWRHCLIKHDISYANYLLIFLSIHLQFILIILRRGTEGFNKTHLSADEGREYCLHQSTGGRIPTTAIPMV